MNELFSLGFNLFFVPIFSDIAKNSGMKFIKKISFFFKKRCFEAKICKYIFDYCRTHSDTILASGDFECFLRHQKPLLSICDYASGKTETTTPTNTFVNSLVVRCKESVGELDVDDVTAVKELFSQLIKKYQSFFEKSVPAELKAMQATIMRGETATINAALEKQTNDIHAAIDELPSEVKKILEPILDKQKLDDDTIERTYFLLSNQLFSGNVEVVGMVLMLITSTCFDLEHAIRILLGLISDEMVHPEDTIGNLSKISNHVIQEDLARKIILFNMNNPDSLKVVMAISSLPRELVRIATDIFSHNFSNIIAVTESLEDGFATSQFSVTSTYSSEKELLNQILFMHVAMLPHAGKYQALKSISSDTAHSNIIIRLLLWTTLIDEIDLAHSSEEKIATAKGCFANIKKEQQLFKHLNKHYSKIYWETLLKYALLFDKDEISVFYHSAPDNIQELPDIKSFYIYFLIVKGDISAESVIDFCNKNHDYKTFIEYLMQWDNEPQRIIDFLEDYKYLLSKDCSICCIYVAAIKETKGRDIALDLLNQYKECYAKNLIYLLYVYRMTPSLENVQNMLSLYKSNEFEPFSHTVMDELITILVFNHLYDDALQIILTNEKKGYSSFQNQRSKANILLQQGKHLDALQIYLHLFDCGVNDDMILYKILSLSLQYRRSIPKAIIEAATASHHPQTLTLASKVYLQQNDFPKSQILATQAFLIEPGITTAAQYWLSVQHSQSHCDSPHSVNEGTAVVLTDDKATTVTYCIHKKGISDNLPIMWDGITHVDFEYAVKHDLIFKERNAIILLDNTQYMIKDILSLEDFLAQHAIEILVENDVAQKFSLPKGMSQQENIDAFTRWIEPYLAENSANKLLMDYQNFEQVPLPLFAVANGTRYSYEEFIEAAFNDKNFIIRNLTSTHSSSDNFSGYVLSFSAMLTLVKLGIPYEVLKKSNVSIPESAVELTQMEYIRIMQNKNNDHVATFGKFNGGFYFQEETAAEKASSIQLAIKIKEYAAQLPTEQNTIDIGTTEITGEKFAQLLGAVDYDVLSIAKHEQKCIVSDEPVLVSVCQFDQFQIESVSVLDFLVALRIKPDDLLDTMKQLTGMRFLIPITITAVNYLTDAYSNMSLKDKSSFMKCWSEYQCCFEDTDSLYKSRLIPTFKELISQHGIADKEPSFAEMDIWEKILQCYMNLIGVHLQINFDENENFQIEIVSNEYNNLPS